MGIVRISYYNILLHCGVNSHDAPNFLLSSRPIGPNCTVKMKNSSAGSTVTVVVSVSAVVVAFVSVVGFVVNVLVVALLVGKSMTVVVIGGL